MTQLLDLQIANFRNLQDVSFVPGSGFNVISGENASGKTSLLEAIHVLSTNRSFRTNNPQNLIAHAQDKFTLFTRVQVTATEHYKLGLSRNRAKENHIKIDGQPAKRSSDLAKLLPVVAIQPSSFELIDGPPMHRRSLLDWLVFHVKPEFLEHWRNHQRCLKQRNSLLRSGTIDRINVAHWSALYVASAQALDALRQPVQTMLNDELAELLQSSELLSNLGITLSFLSGWGEDREIAFEQRDEAWYLARLNACLELDMKQGFSQLGSHKHDIKIRTCSGKASEFLSRGQKKALILLFYLSLARILSRVSGKKSVFLLDDLPSELDQRHLNWLCEVLRDLDSQVFISAVDEASITQLPLFKEEKTSFGVFHVKHGELKSLTSASI